MRRALVISAAVAGVLAGAVDAWGQSADSSTIITIEEEGGIRIDGRRIILQGDARLDAGGEVLTISPRAASASAPESCASRRTARSPSQVASGPTTRNS